MNYDDFNDDFNEHELMYDDSCTSKIMCIYGSLTVCCAFIVSLLMIIVGLVFIIIDFNYVYIIVMVFGIFILIMLCLIILNIKYNN